MADTPSNTPEQTPRSEPAHQPESASSSPDAAAADAPSPGSSASAVPPVRSSVWILGLMLVVAVYAVIAYLRPDDEHTRELRIWNDAVRESPDAWRPRQNRGAVLLGMGDLQGAMADFQAALKIDPSSAITYCHIGMVWQKSGNEQEAIAAYKRAIELDPKYQVAPYTLGNVHLEAGRLKEAVEAFTLAVEIDPEFSMALSNRGFANLMLKNLDAAAADAKRCEEIEGTPTRWAHLLQTPDRIPSPPGEQTPTASVEGDGSPPHAAPGGAGTTPDAVANPDAIPTPPAGGVLPAKPKPVVQPEAPDAETAP